MKRYAFVLLTATAFSASLAAAQETVDTVRPRRITLQEAVELARTHNHDIRMEDHGLRPRASRMRTDIARSERRAPWPRRR